MDEKVSGRGLNLAEIREPNKNAQQNTYESNSVVSTSQKDFRSLKKLVLKSTLSKLEKNSEPKLSGRGKILSKVHSFSNISEDLNKKETKETTTSTHASHGLGRGQFLAQLVKQANKSLESDKGSNSKNFTIPEDLERTSESVAKLLDNQLDELILDTKLPLVKKGELGQQVPVATNYIAIKTNPNKSVFIYEVDFQPEIDYKGFRFKLVNQYFKFTKGVKCYDGGNTLYLPDKVTSTKLIVDTKHPNDETPLVLTITFKREMTLKECSSFYNILFHNCAKVLQLARIGRGNYDFRQKLEVPQHKLEIWPGYITSVNEFDEGILLCCEIRHKVLRNETPYEVLANITKSNPKNFRTVAAKELLGQCVLTRYNNSLYRIDDIDWEKTPMSTFKLSNGEEITFIDYYKKQYNIKIRDEKQPLLINMSKIKNRDAQPKLICLVPEICHLTGLTDKMKNDIVLMKNVANYTKITPAQRYYGLKKFLKSLKSNEHAQAMLNDWGLNIDDEPIRLNSRILPTENLYFKNKMKVPVPLNATWSKFIREFGVMRSVNLKYWIFLHTVRDTNLANKFKEMLKKVCVGLGLEISEPRVVPLKDDKIETCISGLRNNISRDTQIIVCLFPTLRTDKYSAVKKFCCTEIPVPSQIVNCTTIMKESRMHSVVQNVALQINNKIGGASWGLHIPLKNCMICGIDTFHEKSSNSVGGFVASLDADFTKWFSRTCIQQPKQELLDGLVFCFISALKKYLAINNVLPERVFIFRDGVSDGFLKYVKNHEVQQFLDAFELVANNYKPKLSFVVVSKKINQKFFDCSNGLGDALENPKHGSVVDRGITRPIYYEFFIVSQFVSVGTAMPSHYLVLYDSNDLKPDLMQRLSYKLCHLYYNWTGTIRVPAPCQYAHKLAYLIGENVKNNASKLLEDKLYFL